MAHIVVGTAGHIDHGKSTLVHALTGIDPDRLREEKERGITIELGFAHTVIAGVTVAFVDVPGHERFVRTMLAGVGGIDCVTLIVAADESVMPQTREHFDICRLLNVAQGLVVITKADLVDEEMLEITRLEIRELVAGSFLAGAPMIAVSARTGAGLDELRTTLAGMAARVGHRADAGATRLPIDRAFTMQGFGTVVTGTLVAGRLHTDDELALIPGDRRVRVRGVQVHGRRCDEATAGQRTAVNLGGVDVGDVHRGQSLVTPGTLTVTRRVDATIDLLDSAKPLKHGARVRFHQGTMELLGRVSIARPAATEVSAGSSAPARIRFEGAAALSRGDRFILRAYSPAITIGGGRILDPDPPRSGARTVGAASRFAALRLDEAAESDDLVAITQMVADAGPQGVAVATLTPRAGMPPEAVPRVVAALEAGGQAHVVGDRLVAQAALGALRARLMTVVGDFHKAQPLAQGIPREEARERVFARAHPAVFDFVLTQLASANLLVVRDRLALPGHRLELTPDEHRAHQDIERAYRQAGLKPPDSAAVAAEGNISPNVVEKLTSLLLRQKVLVRVDSLIFHGDALSALKSQIQAMKATAPGGRATVDVAMFKDRFNVTRKFAIPLLEWLDRERVTKRVGDSRVVL